MSRGEKEVFDGAEDEEEGGGLMRVRWRTRAQLIRQTSDKANLSVEVCTTRVVVQLHSQAKKTMGPVITVRMWSEETQDPPLERACWAYAVPELTYVPPLECLGHGARERIRWRAC